jgi:hypothetical protein
MKSTLFTLATAGLALVMTAKVDAQPKSGAGVSRGGSGGSSFRGPSNFGAASKIGPAVTPKVSQSNFSPKIANNGVFNTNVGNQVLNGNKGINPNANKGINPIGNKGINPNANKGINPIGNKGIGQANGGKGLVHHMRPLNQKNYHLNHGRQFNWGWCFQGRHHNHWSFCYHDHRYGCYLYYCPCTCGYFYWCETDVCYYPISYCPYNTYCGCTTVIDTTCPVVTYEMVCE